MKRILILTQKVDTEDPVLGFFHGWIKEIAKRSSQVIVVGLSVGRNNLPSNVKVLSLGKESGKSRVKYIRKLCSYVWKYRHEYDSVFVHMNQEYLLLLGWWWVLGNYKVYLWRNHHAGNLLTDLASLFCDKIFCTSRYSFTAKYKKTVLMPVGIDTSIFYPNTPSTEVKNSILFLSRISPVKRPDFLLEALIELSKQGKRFEANFYGDPLSSDTQYYEGLKKTAQKIVEPSTIKFHAGIPHSLTPDIYRKHGIFVNLSPSGMYDKTIFEAAACGVLPLCSNLNLKGIWDKELLFKEGDIHDLTSKLLNLLTLPDERYRVLSSQVKEYVEVNHSLNNLVNKLISEFETGSPRNKYQALKFALSGGFATAMNFLSFAIFINLLMVNYLVASPVAFFIGTIISFGLQKYWAFRNHSNKEVHSQLFYFFSVSLMGVALNTLLVYGLVEYLGAQHIFAHITSGFVIAALNFFIYRQLIFRNAN